MNARANAALPVMVSVLLCGVLAVAPARAETVWFYGGSFDLAIPADPEATRGWMDDAIIEAITCASRTLTSA
jgi:hypothetical protein